jgi:hypothetical protein
MNEEKIFDESIISNYQELARDIAKGGDTVKSLLDESTTIDNQTKILLDYVSHTSLDTLSLLCNLSAFNMSLINDIYIVIDNLPEQFQNIKTKFRDLVKISKQEHDFDAWARKVADELSRKNAAKQNE